MITSIDYCLKNGFDEFNANVKPSRIINTENTMHYKSSNIRKLCKIILCPSDSLMLAANKHTFTHLQWVSHI